MNALLLVVVWGAIVGLGVWGRVRTSQARAALVLRLIDAELDRLHRPALEHRPECLGCSEAAEAYRTERTRELRGVRRDLMTSWQADQ